MRKQRNLLDSFWERVEVSSNGCWIWTGFTDTKGYGVLVTDGRRAGSRKLAKSHRFSYELHSRVEIPPGMEIHHQCRQRDCVNPDHLELMSKSDHSKFHHPVWVPTYCPNGHPYAGCNLLMESIGKGRIGRRCRICRVAQKRKSVRAYRERQKEKSMWTSRRGTPFH